VALAGDDHAAAADRRIGHRPSGRAVAQKDLPTLDEVRFESWKEGRSAQVLHVGPYVEEAPTIALLHDTIDSAGWRPRGRHHEIYLSDARRSAPERLRTILRHPVEPA